MSARRHARRSFLEFFWWNPAMHYRRLSRFSHSALIITMCALHVRLGVSKWSLRISYRFTCVKNVTTSLKEIIFSSKQLHHRLISFIVFWLVFFHLSLNLLCIRAYCYKYIYYGFDMNFWVYRWAKCWRDFKKATNPVKQTIWWANRLMLYCWRILWTFHR